MIEETIMPYKQRENIKKIGWEAYHRDTTPDEKAYGLLMVIDSHYWRAREFLESNPKKKSFLKKLLPKKYSPGYELDIDHYTPHWMFSMKKFISQHVLDVLESKYGYKMEGSPYLPEGMTVYLEKREIK